MVSTSIQNRVALFNYFEAVGLIITLLHVTNGYILDHLENTEHIEQIAGQNIILFCDLKGLTEDGDAADIKYNWHYKQCGIGSGGPFNCYDSSNNIDWTELPCEKDICQAELQLRNVSAKYSGLYKCTAVLTKSTNLAIQLVKSFQVDIKTNSHKMPEFFDEFPLNKSVSLGSQAVFQCLIFSEEHLTVKWFRRLPARKSATDYGNLNSMVYYKGRAYELMTTPRKKSIGRNVYLSKLILNEVRPQDEGFYACVAINAWGHKIREAHLYIKDNEDLSSDYWLDSGEESDDTTQSDPNKFWLLFLMPVGLALLPITVWLCFVAHKRCRQQTMHQTKCSEDKLASADEHHKLNYQRENHIVITKK